MGTSKRNSQTARYLRADIPRVAADDQFIAILADLAGSSTPAAERSRVGRSALGIRIAAVAASVAVVFVGAAYAVDRFGGDDRAPVGPTDTVEPASPSEPGEGFEENDGDLAPHNLDEGEHLPQVGAGNGDQNDTGFPDQGAEGSEPEAPAPPSQAGQPGQDSQDSQDAPEQNQTDPKDDSHGSPAPNDGTGPSKDSSGPADDADPRPEVDPDDPETDADAEASDAGQADAPDAERDRGAEADDR